MSFLLLEAIRIKKSFAGRTVLDVPLFQIYEGDRIGFVGVNGGGKTTLLNILTGTLAPDEGIIKSYCDAAYIRQFNMSENINDESDSIQKLSEYGVLAKTGQMKVSGGEATRIKIASALGEPRQLVFADEPTTNLDADGILKFGNDLDTFASFILISHDRDLLNRLCNKIMTIENYGLTICEGNYDAFARQQEAKRQRAFLEYGQYMDEKERLQKVYTVKKSKAAKTAKKPKNISSSEMKQRDFTSTSRSFDGRQQGFERAAKNIQMRIDHMETKEKPADPLLMKLNFSLTDPPRNKIVLSGENISFAYGENIILDNASFEIKNGSRVAVKGPNGSGKTTLFDLIADLEDERIYRVPKAKIGYFYQGLENLDLNGTVLQNAAADSVQNETTIRRMLARMLFSAGDIGKKAGVLSGGERIKLSLAKLLVSHSNMLMLDEPTNYLDMPSIEVLQSILLEYEGTILFASHDKAFSEAVATEVLRIENKKLVSDEINPFAKTDSGRLLLEHQMTLLASEISQAGIDEKEALNARYMELARALRSFAAE
jgi:macrolide transport system ATP-binding/permease protein